MNIAKKNEIITNGKIVCQLTFNNNGKKYHYVDIMYKDIFYSAQVINGTYKGLNKIFKNS